ncbi:MAG: lipopolysaccharide kinase InaA family protein [Planctomycetota bacterium]
MTFQVLWNLDGDPVAVSRTSSVVRLPPGVLAPPAVYLKRYWYPGCRDRLKGSLRNTFLGPSRAEREWFYLLSLWRRHLSPLRPVAFGEDRRLGWLRRAFIATEEIPGSRSALEVWAGASDRDRAALLVALGRWIGSLHDAGFRHGGLRLRNVLVLPDASLAAIDPPKARWFAGPIRARRPAWSELRAVLEEVAPRASLREVLGFWRAYLGRVLPGPNRRQRLRTLLRKASHAAALSGRPCRG